MDKLDINENDKSIFIMGIEPEFLKKHMENITDKIEDEIDVGEYLLNIKKTTAKEMIKVAVRNAMVVGMETTPFVDATVISTTEMIEINSLAEIYDIKKYDESIELMRHIFQMGTVGVTVKETINSLRETTNSNIKSDILNSIIAGAIAGAIGKGSIYIFEEIYLENMNVQDVGWATEIINSELSSKFIEEVQKFIKKLTNETDINLIIENVLELFTK